MTFGPEAIISGLGVLATAGLWLRMGRMEQADRDFEKRQTDILDRLKRLEDWLISRVQN